jgi:hypothetical protein
MGRSLYDLLIEENGQIMDFEDKRTADLSTSMGLSVGKDVRCISRTGTVVIATSHQTIAVCKSLARKIYVR